VPWTFFAALSAVALVVAVVSAVLPLSRSFWRGR
jgi:hypothetical protein